MNGSWREKNDASGRTYDILKTEVAEAETILGIARRTLTRPIPAGPVTDCWGREVDLVEHFAHMVDHTKIVSVTIHSPGQSPQVFYVKDSSAGGGSPTGKGTNSAKAEPSPEIKRREPVKSCDATVMSLNKILNEIEKRSAGSTGWR